jgi:transcription initiation factor TFIIIB Brf1 subunit/transcription initiation factor TFIIB
LSHAVESLAATMAGQATELMPGKKPSSLAAGAILLAAELRGEPRSAHDIAQVASIAPTTVSSVYKALQAAPALNLEPRNSSLER